MDMETDMANILLANDTEFCALRAIIAVVTIAW